MTEGCDVMGVMESSGTLGGGYDQPHFLLGKPRYRVSLGLGLGLVYALG